MNTKTNNGNAIIGIAIIWIAISIFWKSCTSPNAKNATPDKPPVETAEQLRKKRELSNTMAEMIRAKGLWCSEVKDIKPHLFGQSPNKRGFYVWCKDERYSVSYDVYIMNNTYSVIEK